MHLTAKMSTLKRTNYRLFPILLLLFALNTNAQPGGSNQSYNFYFTLPPGMEDQFEFGPLDASDLNLICQFHFNPELYRPSKTRQSIFFEEPTHSEPAQIHVWHSFEMAQYEFLAVDSVDFSFQWNEKNYSTIILSDQSNDGFIFEANGCITDFANKSTSLVRFKCKTSTQYEMGRPEPNTLNAIISHLKHEKRLKQTQQPSSAQILRVVNSDNEPLFPLVIANGDTCEIADGNGINANVLPFSWENQKISLKIFHPDYPSLKLDSVSRQGGLDDYVNLLNEDEAYYLDGGKRMPLDNGYKELAFWFDPTLNDQSLDSIIHVLTTSWGLELTKDWRKIIREEKDSLEAGIVEFMYGGFDTQLKRVLHFKTNNDQDFSQTYNIADKFVEIREVQIPVSFHEYLVPRLTIHFKSGLTEKDILQFEEEYLPAFKQVDYDPYRAEFNLISRTYQFNDWIYVPNHLQEVIMHDRRVKYCGGTLHQHTIFD